MTLLHENIMAKQPAHSCGFIAAFDIRSLENIISKLATLII